MMALEMHTCPSYVAVVFWRKT